MDSAIVTARLYLTVYEPDDLPTEAAHVASKSIGTVDSASELEACDELHGLGYVKIKINRHHADAAFLRADRYVIWHTDDGPQGGAFLKEAPIDLSAAEGPSNEWMEWTGEGPMSILRNARMDADSNIAGGHNPIEGYWDLSAQGPSAGADSGHPIPMMKRALVEAQLQSPNAISVVDHSSWTYDADTDAAVPPFWTGSYGVNVGDDLLTMIGQFDQLGGVVFRMSYLFELSVHLTYGTDKSGAFGAGTVRFEKGVNIADSIQRKVRGAVNYTHLIVGGSDRVFVTVPDPDYVAGDVVRYGFLPVPETSDTSSLQEAGLAYIEARKRQTDSWVFPLHDHGDTPASGIYEPGTHYVVGDTVSLHTGTGEYDANEQTAPVAAVTWRLKTGDEANGDYWVIPEIGSTFEWGGLSPFAGREAPGSQHRVYDIFFEDATPPEDEGFGRTMRMRDLDNGAGVHRYTKITSATHPDVYLYLAGSVDLHSRAGGGMDIEADGGMDIDSGGGMNIRAGGGLEIQADGGMNIRADNDLDVYAPVSQTFELWGATPGRFRFIGGNGLVIPVRTADPAAGDSQDGQVYYNSTTHKYRVRRNGAWEDVDAVAAASVTTHEGAADPHTGYQKESEKNALSGYPGLSAAGFIAPGQIASGAATDRMPMVQADSTLAYVAPSTTTNTVANASGGGTADNWSRGDHTHALSSFGAVAGRIMVRSGGLWDVLPVPTTGQVLEGDTAETLKMKWVANPLDAHLADTSDAHDAAAVSIADSAGDFTATDVEGALAELQTDNEAHAALDYHASSYGSSFPAQPAYGNNKPFYRTDRNLEYFYDGTRWLSTTLYREPLAMQDALIPTATAATITRLPMWGTDHALWAVSLYTYTIVSGTNGASDYWTMSLYAEPGGTFGFSLNTSAHTPNTHQRTSGAIGSVIASTEYAIILILAKTGAPGSLYLTAALSYRLIG
jgi:hypothetical protein